MDNSNDSRKDPADKSKTPVRERCHWLFRIIKYFTFFVFIICSVSFAFIYWAAQTENGQTWLAEKLTSILSAPEGSDRLSFKILQLQGALPSHFSFRLQAFDQHGLWLDAPDNKFEWDWKQLPGLFRIPLLESGHIELIRLPHLPPGDETPQPKEPFTVEKLQQYLTQASSFLAEKHWWLPAIEFGAIKASAFIPASLVNPASKEEQKLLASAALSASFKENKLDAGVQANISDSTGKSIELANFTFASGGIDVRIYGAPAQQGLNLKGDIKAFLEQPNILIRDLPSDLLGSAADLSLSLELNAITRSDEPSLKLIANGPTLDAGVVQLNGGGSWQTDENWKTGQISGPADYQLGLEIKPFDTDRESPLSVLTKPVALTLAINGILPRIDLEIAMQSEELSYSGINARDTSLKITANQIDIPLDNVDKFLERENSFHLNLESELNDKKGELSTNIFFQRPSPVTWRAGVDDLRLRLLGVHGTGSVEALIGPHRDPAINGQLQVKIDNFSEAAILLPKYKFMGSAQLNMELASHKKVGKGGETATSGSQAAHMDLNIPLFNMQGDSKPIEIKGFHGDITLDDLFENPGIAAKIALPSLKAAGLNLGMDATANGSLKDSLHANVKITGDVHSGIVASWKPGDLQVNQLELAANLSPFLAPNGKEKKIAGIRSAAPIRIAYGDSGIQLQKVDIRLQPAGQLLASGGLSPDKLGMNIELRDFNLKQWQKIIPQLPVGEISLAAKLNGTPTRPSGDFRLSVNKLALPKVPLPPVGLSLQGNITHSANGSMLNAHMNVDPATIKALGGSEARFVTALPLIFAKNGIPSLNMKGPLQAVIKWDGSLGPIWNLLPIPDRRLNGRVAIDVKAGGTLTQPRINGQARISQARYEDLLLGILLTDINLGIELADNGRASKGPFGDLPGSMKLNLAISDGRGGIVTAQGSGALNGSNLNIAAKIDRLRPLRRRDIFIELSGDASVKGSAVSPSINGNILVNQGEILLNNIEMTSSVVTLPITNPKAASKNNQAQAKNATKPSTEHGQLNVRIRMLPRFSIQGRGLASLWKADLLIAGALNDPRITGEITCVRGNFDFLGKVFALSRGIVFFGGGSLSNPLVDVDLTHETDDFTAHILVTGPVNKIKVTLSSDPSLPRDEIISRVLFGRSVNDLSRMEMLQLAGAVAQLAGFGGGSSLLGKAKKALGVDVLRLGTADTGSENQSMEDTGGGTTIEMGKYLNDYIYMGVQQGFSQDSTAFILEFELTPHSNLEIRTEQNNTWGGYKWKLNY